MKTENYTYLLAHPQNVGPTDLKELALVIEKYPFFQSARALQLKGLKNEHSFLYNDALKQTAAYTTDRDILFEYITSENFVQNEIAQNIKQHDTSVNEIEVLTEDLSATISSELNQQIKAELQKAEAILNPDLFERKIESIGKIVEEQEEINPSEVLGINKPLEFTKTDTHSFSEWLKLTTATPIDRSNSEEKRENVSVKSSQTEKNRKFELIEKFIQQKPKMVPKDVSTENVNLAAPYTQSSSALMTETLAKVYLQQKNYKKAIQAYKILILKYPEKSGFFADQIRAIQKLTNTEEK